MTNTAAGQHQEFRAVARAWRSATYAVIRHRLFQKRVLGSLLCLVGLVSGYNAFVWSVSSDSLNSFFAHRQWVPGISLGWGWEGVPGVESADQIQNCLAMGSNLEAPVTDYDCEFNYAAEPSAGKHGFPFSVSDGGSYNPVAQELNNSISVLSGATILTALWFGFWRKRAVR